jgi:glyoxylase-like metal-dependent hydrolase (beta-lactamase superfamily II)
MTQTTGVTVTGTAQQEAWLERAMPPVEQLRTDLWSIPVSIPANPLRYTSVYVLATDSSLTLIDTGTNTAEGWQALCDGLSSIGATVSDISGCLVTHFHYDHLGLAARIRSEVGAWVGMHPADAEVVKGFDRSGTDASRAAALDWFLSLGASSAEAHQLAGDEVVGPEVRAVIGDPDRLIEDGDPIGIAGWDLRAVHTPGHTPGHLCFVDGQSRTLFAGDHLLPRISPNVSVDRHFGSDALGDFLASLDKIAALDLDEAMPAHEWRFRGVPQRVEQLHRHHEHRLAELLDVVRRHPGGVPWELAGELTWSRPWSQYGGVMRLSAVGETTSHLVHLVRLGKVKVTEGPVPRYTAV